MFTLLIIWHLDCSRRDPLKHFPVPSPKVECHVWGRRTQLCDTTTIWLAPVISLYKYLTLRPKRLSDATTPMSTQRAPNSSTLHHRRHGPKVAIKSNTNILQLSLLHTSALYILISPPLTLLHNGTPLMLYSWFECSANGPRFTCMSDYNSKLFWL